VTHLPNAPRRRLARLGVIAVSLAAVAASSTMSAATAATTAVTAVPVPVRASYLSHVDSWARYTAESSCSPTEKPGPQRLRSLLRATYGTTSYNIVRPCSSAISGHEEGRSLDWMRSVSVPAQRAQVTAFLGWLLGYDALGNRAAAARRMGIVYIIWNHYQWSSYPRTSKCDGKSYPAAVWSPYCGAVPHTDHVHFSFSWDGALAHTSYYTGWPYLACEGASGCPVTRIVGADRYATSALVSRTVPSGGAVVLTAGSAGHVLDALVAAPLASHLRAPLLLSTPAALPPSVSAEIARRHPSEAYLVSSGPDPLGEGVVAGLDALGVHTVHRITAADPVALSAAVAAAFGSATSALVASPTAPADIAGAVGPAGVLGQPLLLVPATGVPSATSAVLSALGVTSTLVVATPTTVPATVLAALPAPTRITPVDRYATASTVTTWYASRLPSDSVQILPGDDAALADAICAVATGRLTLLTSPTALARQTGLWLTRHPEVRHVVLPTGTVGISTLTAAAAAGVVATR
jgi:hypothetical protein